MKNELISSLMTKSNLKESSVKWDVIPDEKLKRKAHQLGGLID